MDKRKIKKEQDGTNLSAHFNTSIGADQTKNTGATEAKNIRPKGNNKKPESKSNIKKIK